MSRSDFNARQIRKSSCQLRACVCLFGLLLAATPNVFALTININPGAALAANTAALDAFSRAGLLWASRFSDPITVNIEANLVAIGSPNIIGQASSVVLAGGFDTVVNAIKADASAESDDGVVAFLPSAAQFSAFVPSGFVLDGRLGATKANFKALGFTGLDAQFGATDATIQFNTGFAFDFDNSNGVGAGLVDFETVAAHEIGHALGFVSIVDTIDFLFNPSPSSTFSIAPRAMDLFRFSDDVGLDNPDTASEFTNGIRNLLPGGSAFFDDLDDEFALSTGVFNGDGRQASHFKDNGLTGVLIGNLDPTLSASVVVPLSDADLRVLDLIGYDLETVLATPVPAAFWLFGSGVLLLCCVVRRNAE